MSIIHYGDYEHQERCKSCHIRHHAHQIDLQQNKHRLPGEQWDFTEKKDGHFERRDGHHERINSYQWRKDGHYERVGSYQWHKDGYHERHDSHNDFKKRCYLNAFTASNRPGPGNLRQAIILLKTD